MTISGARGLGNRRRLRYLAMRGSIHLFTATNERHQRAQHDQHRSDPDQIYQRLARDIEHQFLRTDFGQTGDSYCHGPLVGENPVDLYLIILAVELQRRRDGGFDRLPRRVLRVLKRRLKRLRLSIVSDLKHSRYTQSTRSLVTVLPHGVTFEENCQIVNLPLFSLFEHDTCFIGGFKDLLGRHVVVRQ